MGDTAVIELNSQAEHAMRMSGRSAFYSFSFDLGADLDYIALANGLLKNDMATVAGSPTRDGLRVGRRVANTHRFHRKAARSAEFYNVLYEEKFSIPRLWKIDKLHTLKIVWALRVVLCQAVLKWAKASLGYPVGGDDHAESGASSNKDASESIDDSRTMMNTAVDGIRETFMNELVIGAMRLRLEQQIYFPRYYAQLEPFIRLEMNRTHVTVDDLKDESIEVSLMVHRSGICILTFATSVDSELDFRSAYNALYAGARSFDSIKLSAPIFSNRWSRPDIGNVNVHAGEEIHEGLRWFSLTRDQEDATSDPITMVDIFYFYLHAIESVARRRIRYEWRCFSTLFLGEPVCGCSGSEAKRNHGIEFGQLLIRSRSPYPVKDEFRNELLENHLVTTHREMWLSAGCAIHTYWNEKTIDYLGDIEVIEPVEFAILQYSQVEAVDTRTVNVSVKDRDLFNAQQQIATNMPEYGRNLMSDVDAPRIVSRLGELLTTPQIATRINDRVKVLESIVNTRFTRRQARRSLAISSIGLIVVILLLLPRVDEMVRKLLVLTPTSGVMTAIIEYFGTPDRAIFAIYWLFLAVTLAIFAVFTVRVSRSRPWRWQRRRFGYRTVHEVRVTRAPQPESEGGASLQSEPARQN